MTQSLVRRIKAETDYAARVALIESLTNEEIIENRDEIKLLIQELRGTLNTLVDKLVDAVPIERNEEKAEYNNHIITWNKEYFMLDPNKISSDTTVQKYLRALAEQYNIDHKKLINKNIRTRKHERKFTANSLSFG